MFKAPLRHILNQSSNEEHSMKLERESNISLKRQIYQTLKDQILCGDLPAGEPLPSTRVMAAELFVSRNTICDAYDMLITEGYVANHQGSPTRVATGLDVQSHQPHNESHIPSHKKKYCYNFRTGLPDLDLFPIYLWQQIMRRTTENLHLEDLDYSGPEGMPVLRREIAAWLFRGRGIRVLPENIFITAGATQALHLIPTLLQCRGKEIAVEDPCNRGLYETLLDAGVQIHPIPVDKDGLMPEYLSGVHVPAIYLTPSHQFPLGGILPAYRRAELIRYARSEGAYLIEDDYDSEFRFEGDPVSPLYSMDPDRVIYVGTFSKVLFPAIRIGYVILPELLHDTWCDLRLHTDVQNSPFEQAALAELLQTRKFDRHIRSMRKVYGERRLALLEALKVTFGDTWQSWGDAAGLHLAIEFENLVFDEKFISFCREKGLRVTSVEYHSICKGAHGNKLLLGYGHLSPQRIREGIEFLHCCLEMYQKI